MKCSPSMSLSKTALITGASRGIGAAIATRLARDGHTVLINYRSNEEAAQRICEHIRNQGGKAELTRFDVTSREEVQAALAELQSRHHISILVNNAGLKQDKAFPALDFEAWEQVTRTALDGFYNVTHALVMPMIQARQGRIINIASLAGVVGNRGQVNYSAAKAGLIGATRSLAIELAKRKITVNAIAPGWIETDMLEGASLEELLPQIPMRRLGRPEEVASLVSFLAGEESAYITGQVIGINGGVV